MAKDRKGTCLLVGPVPRRELVERASGEVAPVREVPQMSFFKIAHSDAARITSVVAP